MLLEATAIQGSTIPSKTTAQLADDVFCYRLELTTAAYDLRNRLSVAGCEIRELHWRLSAHLNASEAGISGCLESIEHSMSHINRLMEDLLEFATEQTDPTHDRDRQSVDLVACASRVVAQVCSAAHAPHLTVRTNVPTL